MNLIKVQHQPWGDKQRVDVEVRLTPVEMRILDQENSVPPESRHLLGVESPSGSLGPGNSLSASFLVPHGVEVQPVTDEVVGCWREFVGYPN